MPRQKALLSSSRTQVLWSTGVLLHPSAPFQNHRWQGQLFQGILGILARKLCSELRIPRLWWQKGKQKDKKCPVWNGMSTDETVHLLLRRHEDLLWRQPYVWSNINGTNTQTFRSLLNQEWPKEIILIAYPTPIPCFCLLGRINILFRWPIIFLLIMLHQNSLSLSLCLW